MQDQHLTQHVCMHMLRMCFLFFHTTFWKRIIFYIHPYALSTRLTLLSLGLSPESQPDILKSYRMSLLFFFLFQIVSIHNFSIYLGIIVPFQQKNHFDLKRKLTKCIDLHGNKTNNKTNFFEFAEAVFTSLH